MAINKITKSPTPTELMEKVNEVVDKVNIPITNADTVDNKHANNTNDNIVIWGADGKLNFPNGTQFWIG